MLSKELIRQLCVFVAVGVVNTLTDFAIYYGLTRYIYVYFVYANIVSVGLATVMAFFLHKHITFQNDGKDYARQFIKFLTVSMFCFLLNNFIVFAAVHWLNIFDILGKLLATLAVMIASYIFQRWWVFMK